MEFPNLTASWVQVGELGFAFVVIILATWLILFVMKSNSKRESQLLQIIENQNSAAVRAQEINTRLIDAVNEVADRLAALEMLVRPGMTKIKVKARRRTNKKAAA